MRFAKQGALILLAGATAFGCAAESASDDDTSTATGGVTSTGTGGDTTGAGGTTTSTGGTTTSTGGTTTSTGGTTTSTGGTTTGSVTPCQGGAGTVTATETPNVLAWEVQDGSAATTPTGTAAGPITLTAVAGSSDPYISAILSTWAASGRECVDVSAFTGVEFDLSGTASDIIFKVGVSAADPSGHCTAAADCYANPQKSGITTGTDIRVPFAELMPPGWGVNASFDAKQVLTLVWATTDHAANLTVSNVSFY